MRAESEAKAFGEAFKAALQEVSLSVVAAWGEKTQAEGAELRSRRERLSRNSLKTSMYLSLVILVIVLYIA